MKSKQILRVMFVAAVGFSPAIAIHGQAQNPATQTRDDRPLRDRTGANATRPVSEASRDKLRQAQVSGIKPAQKIIGMNVKDAQGQALAKIEDLVVDVQRGTVSYVILGSGGFLGIGEKLVAVPARQFRLADDRNGYVLNVTKQKLEAAPNFEKTAWPDTSDRAWQEVISNYHGEGVGPGTGEIAAEKRLGMMRASELADKNIKTVGGEDLGEVWDLMVDLPKGRILFVAIEDKPFRSEMAHVPPTLFQAGPDKNALYVNTDVARMKKAPRWDYDKSNDYTGEYVTDVYAVYAADPNWIAESYPADNSKRNVRDASGDTLTPFDQGTSAADREITRALRKWIVVEPGKDRFSGLAHNIKIVTRDGKVTLRGPVQNDQERVMIEKYAKELPGVTAVDNQLEVKP